ncbi:MAG: prepilin peptidase [Verrucomicrobiales bacterium]|nr:prepilin peptidase [Verrucomicrobiales bacterium]
MNAALLAAPLFDRDTWASVPFHFWTGVFGVFGLIVGSFLNVCIHRMPRGESLVHPPSRCPQCESRIPWRYNLPILGWLLLGGKCAHCAHPISSRYVWVEGLTGALFAGVWVGHGHAGPLVAVALCLFAASLVVATFIDIEHLIIPDEITIGGAVVGVVLSVLLPGIHGETFSWPSLKASVIGAVIGSGVVLGVLEFGKLLFGRQRFQLPPEGRIVFTESEVCLPDRSIPYEDVFYRNSDTLVFHARHLELVDRCYRDVTVRLRLRAGSLTIGDEELDPATVVWMAAHTDEVTVPREAMGFGDVKFMAAIGAFTGWQGVIFALLGSSVAALAASALLTVLGRREWTARIPYGPYLAAAALAWILGAREWFVAWMMPPGL